MPASSALADDPSPAGTAGAGASTGRAAEGWSLCVVRGPGRGTTVALVLAETLVGRIDSNAVVLDDPSVSRVHARLRLDRDGLEIEDLGSRAGTAVNGKPIRGPVALHDGDEIVLGRVALVLSGPRPASAG